MNDYTKKIINLLLEKYEGSKISKGCADIKRRIQLNSNNSATFKKYFISSDSYKYKDIVIIDLVELEKKNLLRINYNRSNSIESIELIVDNVDELYTLVSRENPLKTSKLILNYLESCSITRLSKNFIEYEINYINNNLRYSKKYYKNIDQLKMILLCLNELSNLEEVTKERDFSVRVLNDSKKFATIRSSLITILKDFDDETNFEDFENEDQILEHYNIEKNSTYVLVKNNLKFKINNQEIDLNKLGFEFSLSDEMIKALEIIPSVFKRIITVENLTSFYKLDDKEAIIIYLAGFHNHTKQLLLKKLYKQYPNIEYYHFSDIDVGGFRIYNHLVNSTKIPFIPYKMGIEELNSNSNHKSLTDNDIKSLKEMIDKPEFAQFKNVIKFMLDNNIKLEQESLD